MVIASEHADLDAARAGDLRAFDRLVTPLRRQVLAHCYRMLGSHQDAEEETQETLLRAWRSLASYEGRGSFRSWLYRIATNVCMNAIEGGRRRRRLFAPFELAPAERPPTGRPDPEADWLEPLPTTLIEEVAEPSPDAEAILTSREATRIAFVAALQLLPPRQRAVLLLRDVVGFSAEETAGALDLSVAAANSALQRARAATEERARVRMHVNAEVETALLSRYIAAWDSFDLELLISLLKEHARYSMPPWLEWYDGRDAIGAFFGFAWREGGYRGFRAVACSVNGQPSVAIYACKSTDNQFRAHSIHLLDADNDGIVEIVAFMGPKPFVAHELPRTLPPEA